MHGRLAENAALLQAVAKGAGELPADVRVGVCVPTPYLAQAQSLLDGSRVMWGVQDVSAFTQGAYTGEVSAQMVTDFAATFAIVGHSERRAYHRESAELVAVKTQRALEAGLTPIVCVGETLEEREAGATEQVVGAQLDEVLAKLSVQEVARIVVAYEPVWAIGAPEPAGHDHIRVVAAALRAALDADLARAGSTVIYGGAAGPGLLTALGDAVDGVFLGRFAHDPDALMSVLDEAVSAR